MDALALLAAASQELLITSHQSPTTRITAHDVRADPENISSSINTDGFSINNSNSHNSDSRDTRNFETSAPANIFYDAHKMQKQYNHLRLDFTSLASPAISKRKDNDWSWLARVFEETPFPSHDALKSVAAKLDLSEYSLTMWFQRMRSENGLHFPQLGPSSPPISGIRLPPPTQLNDKTSTTHDVSLTPVNSYSADQIQVSTRLPPPLSIMMNGQYSSSVNDDGDNESTLPPLHDATSAVSQQGQHQHHYYNTGNNSNEPETYAATRYYRQDSHYLEWSEPARSRNFPDHLRKISTSPPTSSSMLMSSSRPVLPPISSFPNHHQYPPMSSLHCEQRHNNHQPIVPSQVQGFQQQPPPSSFASKVEHGTDSFAQYNSHLPATPASLQYHYQQQQQQQQHYHNHQQSSSSATPLNGSGKLTDYARISGPNSPGSDNSYVSGFSMDTKLSTNFASVVGVSGSNNNSNNGNNNNGKNRFKRSLTAGGSNSLVSNDSSDNRNNGNNNNHGSGNNNNAGADYKKSKRFIMSREHLKWLKKVFEETPFPSSEQMEQISAVVGMDKRQVRVWFQNRRAVEKRKVTAI